MWSSLFIRTNLAIFHDACFQPAPDQANQARVSNSMLNKSEHPIVIETPEEVLQVRLQHPARLAAGDHLIEGRQRIMGAEPWPAAKRAWKEVLLINGGEHLGRAALERPVRDSWNAERAFFLLSGLWNIDASNVRRSVSLTVNGLKHCPNPLLKAFLRRLHCLAIDPGGRALRNLR